MHHERRVVQWGLTLLLVMSVLFGLLSLLPVLAQQPQGGSGAEPLQQAPGDIGAQALVSSTTGYLIDNGAPGFTSTMLSDAWASSPAGGLNGSYLYTVADGDGDYAQWKPDLAMGTYEVLVHYYAHSSHTTDAQYTISYQGGTATHTVNQQLLADGSTPPPAGANSGWLSLGKYNFLTGAWGYVRVRDVTDAGPGMNVIADAVKFAPLEVWVDDNYCSSCANDGKLWGVTAFNSITGAVEAVGDGGTVRVKAGTYVGNIVITKGITVTGESPATTVISVTSGTGISIQANDVTIEGFTIEGAPATTHGIANRDDASLTWVHNISGYRIRRNVIRGFDNGIYLNRAEGEVSGNTLYNNRLRGIWIRDYSSTKAGPTMVLSNTLYANGSAVTDCDITVQDSYSGTLVANNVITGSLGAAEIGMYVLDNAADLSLVTNRVTGCTEGVRVWQVDSEIEVQKVSIRDHAITGGTIGVHAGREAGTTWSERELKIGGSLADSCSIYGNSGNEIVLNRYRSSVDARYNDWGLCNLREIEDQIEHNYDDVSLGIVTFEPALCVPYSINAEAHPTSLPANGVSTAAITVTVRDVDGTYARPGTMVGVTTSLGSVPFGYAEAEGDEVVQVGTWGGVAGSHASGGWYAISADPTATISWTFTGQAVSVIYARAAAAASVDVYVDGTFAKTVDVTSASPPDIEEAVEEVITTTLGSGSHAIELRNIVGTVIVDAFRSGAVVSSYGRINTTLTSTTTVGTARIWATVYDGHVITTSMAAEVWPLITDTVDVEFEGAEMQISKTASAASINTGQLVTFTLTYGNDGPQTATNVVITDTLPARLQYVSSTSSPDIGAPVTVGSNQYVWSIPAVATSTGTITVVARPNLSMAWPAPVNVANVAEISTEVPESMAADNVSSAHVMVVPPAAITMTAQPTAIRVSNGNITTTLRITVTDSSGNPVNGTGVNLTTTAGSFVGGGSSLVVTTANGVAIAGLASSSSVTTATVTASVLPAGTITMSLQVAFKAGLPAHIGIVGTPNTVAVCSSTAVISATILDEFDNPVDDGTTVAFNVVQGQRGDISPRLSTTVNGVATSTLTTKNYRFGERYVDVYVLASREASSLEWYHRVNLQVGHPAAVDFSPSPATIQVNGAESDIEALVTDCGGNPVEAGVPVAFEVSPLALISPTTTTTNSSGRAFTTIRSTCTPGNAVVTATVNGLDFVTTVPVEPGPPDTIFVDITDLSGDATPNEIENCGGKALLTAELLDACNNPVKDGTPVLFTPQYGYVKVNPVLGYTKNGVVTSTVTSLDKELSPWPVAHEQIDVTSGSAMPGFDNLNIRPGKPAIIQVSADPESIPINGDVNGYTATIQALVTDCSGSWVADGISVTLHTEKGFFTETGTKFYTVPTFHGLVTATLTSQSDAGVVTVTASVDEVQGQTTVVFEAGEPYFLEVSGQPTTILADGHSKSLITALVKDFWDNPVMSGVTVTFVTDYGLFEESADDMYTTTTGAYGKAQATLIADDEPHTAMVRAIAYNDRQGYSYVFMAKVLHQVYLPVIRRN